MATVRRDVLKYSAAVAGGLPLLALNGPLGALDAPNGPLRALNLDPPMIVVGGQVS
jgi:hypothetical protein